MFTLFARLKLTFPEFSQGCSYDPQDYSHINWKRVGQVPSINKLMKKVAKQFSFPMSSNSLHNMVMLCNIIYYVKKENVCTYTPEMQTLWRVHQRLVFGSTGYSNQDMQIFCMFSSSVTVCDVYTLEKLVGFWIRQEIRFLRTLC